MDWAGDHQNETGAVFHLKVLMRMAANTRCTRPGYAARFQRLHALLVGLVAKPLARIRPARELCR